MVLPPHEDDGLPELLTVGKNHLLKDPDFGILIGAPFGQGKEDIDWDKGESPSHGEPHSHHA